MGRARRASACAMFSEFYGELVRYLAMVVVERMKRRRGSSQHSREPFTHPELISSLCEEELRRIVRAVHDRKVLVTCPTPSAPHLYMRAGLSASRLFWEETSRILLNLFSSLIA